MALDMNGLLPGTDATSGQALRRRRRGWLKALLLLLLIVAGGYLLVTNFDRLIEGATNLVTFEDAGGDAAPGPDGSLAVHSDGEDELPPVTGDDASDAPADTDSADSPRPDTMEPAPAADTSASARPEPEPRPAATGIAADWERVQILEREGRTAELETLLKRIAAKHSEDAHGASAILRLGLLARKSGDEVLAQKYWRKAYLDLGETVSGRLAALLLADTWWTSYVEANPPVYDQWEAIRDAYAAAIGQDEATFLRPEVKERLTTRLTKLNDRIVFSRYPSRGAEFYTVQPNDRLSDIARHYGVHYDGLATINGIQRPQYFIRVGEKLKILKPAAKVIVDKSDFTLTLYFDGKWIRQYPICHGGPKTVPDEYTIVKKTGKPQWTDPETGRTYPYGHPQNIIGTRWMSFNNTPSAQGLGIHGTTLPHSIPGSSSNGCVRMFNEDVEELYGLVTIGSPVVVRE